MATSGLAGGQAEATVLQRGGEGGAGGAGAASALTSAVSRGTSADALYLTQTAAGAISAFATGGAFAGAYTTTVGGQGGYGNNGATSGAGASATATDTVGSIASGWLSMSQPTFGSQGGCADHASGSTGGAASSVAH